MTVVKIFYRTYHVIFIGLHQWLALAYKRCDLNVAGLKMACPTWNPVESIFHNHLLPRLYCVLISCAIHLKYAGWLNKTTHENYIHLSGIIIAQAGLNKVMLYCCYEPKEVLEACVEEHFKTDTATSWRTHTCSKNKWQKFGTNMPRGMLIHLYYCRNTIHNKYHLKWKGMAALR